MYLAGIDLAWQCESNGSGLAIGLLDSGRLRVLAASCAVIGRSAIESELAGFSDLQGIAIDAPLIINNQCGQRDCERSLAQCYAGRKASCHASNLKLYPDAASVSLAARLQSDGFAHAAPAGKFQLECYPHPALIEMFGLPERLLYKKGRVSTKREGQTRLANLLSSLEHSPILPIHFPEAVGERMRPAYIAALRGQGLKDNEDMLDGIVCLYIAALYAMRQPGQIFGTTEEGYIYVPQVDCRAEAGKVFATRCKSQ